MEVRGWHFLIVDGGAMVGDCNVFLISCDLSNVQIVEDCPINEKESTGTVLVSLPLSCIESEGMALSDWS